MPLFFHGAASGKGLRAAVNGAGIDANFADPIEIQRDAKIGEQVASSEMRDGVVTMDGEARRCEQDSVRHGGSVRSVGRGHEIIPRRSLSQAKKRGKGGKEGDGLVRHESAKGAPCEQSHSD
ncbi:MAG: hypothetical protein PVS2B2_19170 [Candidatus Acidiferrum sp.]